MTTSSELAFKGGVSENVVFHKDGFSTAVQRVDPELLHGVEDVSNFTWCNTCNHRETETYLAWQRDGVELQTYRQIMEETRMEQWQPVLEDLMRSPSCTFIITPTQQRKYFLPSARRVAFQGIKAKHLVGEEASALAKEIEDSHHQATGEPLQPPSQGWFVRTTACSPKDSQEDGGAGPHFSLVSVILALFASERVHVSMRSYKHNTKVYLFPFDPTVTVERELRVFVHQNQVTAMSQYDVYKTSSVFSPMDDKQLAAVSHLVNDFHRTEVLPRWKGIENYVMDVEYCLPDDEQQTPCIQLIELNSFGAEMAAASGLFHWVRDKEELYSSDRLCIRVRAEEEASGAADQDETPTGLYLGCLA